MHCKEQRRIISEIYLFIFQSKFNDLPYRDHITEISGTSKKNQWDFQISKVGSLDFLDLKVNGSSAYFMNFADIVKNGFENTCFTATNKALSTVISVSFFNSFHKLRCLMNHNSSLLYYFCVCKGVKSFG